MLRLRSSRNFKTVSRVLLQGFGRERLWMGFRRIFSRVEGAT
ncbi:hypothetical protein DsansV1_C05g0054611 [Dioscorea sansibarensis]